MIDAIELVSPRSQTPVVLHVFPSFGLGGVPLRMCRIINHLGSRFRHTIIALNGDFDAAEMLSKHIDVRLASCITNKGFLRATISGAAAIRRVRPDLMLTYNWGAIEWALANRLLSLVPHIHLEAGFGKEEADKQILRRVLFRRFALAHSKAIIVPSRVLQRLALHVWKLPASSIQYLPNGVDTARFGGLATEPGITRRLGELIVGTVAPLRPEKNIGRLLRAFALFADGMSVRLLIAGEGVELQNLFRLGAELGISDRIVFTGHVLPETVLGSLDVFAMSSDTEQMPNALLEAMAASRAVAAVDVGDVKDIVSQPNRPFIVPRDDVPSLAESIRKLLINTQLREKLGRSNRAKAVAEFSQAGMFAAYEQLISTNIRSARER